MTNNSPLILISLERKKGARRETINLSSRVDVKITSNTFAFIKLFESGVLEFDILEKYRANIVKKSEKSFLVPREFIEDIVSKEKVIKKFIDLYHQNKGVTPNKIVIATRKKDVEPKRPPEKDFIDNVF